MDPQLVLFRRQYFQLFEPDFLAWPPKSLLRDAGVQQWMYKQCFDTDANPYLPSDRYRLRVLKPLLRKVEQSIENPEEDVGYKSRHLFCTFSHIRAQHPYHMRELSS
jgi:methylphosphotriester-DNA--protein-cysteine methyltransferase